MTTSKYEPEHLMTPTEVAALFHVSPRTVTRWEKAGKLSAIRTLGGHRRFREAEVRALRERAGDPQSAALADVRAILGGTS
jgi:excisionase family DNA binding protein